MKKLITTAMFFAFAVIAFAQAPVTLVDAAKATKEISTFADALHTTGVDSLVKSSGPYTIFAPDNLALNKAPGVATADVLKYHIVRGEFDASKLKSRIADGVDGKYTFTTLAGGKLWAMMDGDRIKIKDEKGAAVWITTSDIKAGNGVIHIVDGVLMPVAPASVEKW